MAFTPNPNLFSQSLGGGIQVGSSLAKLLQDRQDRQTQGKLAQMLQAGDFEGAGAGLVGMGQFGAGMQAMNIPYQREQQALQREFQNEQFMDNRAFRNLAFNADQDYRAQQIGLKKQEIEAAQAEAEAEAAKPRFDDEIKLAKDYQSITQDYRSVRDAYNRIIVSAENPSPAGDMALIFNYMKALDPGSVVRESEFEMAAKSGSFGNQIQSLVSRITSGERLAPEIRADFVDRAKKLYGAAQRQYGKTLDDYRNRAMQYGLDPERTIQDFSSISGMPTVTAVTDPFRAIGDRTPIGQLPPLASTQQPRDASANIKVPNAQNAGSSAQDAIPISSEADLTDAMIGKYVTLNGQTFQVQAD